jgi:hypothetical protein
MKKKKKFSLLQIFKEVKENPVNPTVQDILKKEQKLVNQKYYKFKG